MLRIDSTGTPADAVSRLKTEATFDSLKAVPSVRPALASEQGFRCAYCERRVLLDDERKSRIEHFHPQHGTVVNSHCTAQSGTADITHATISWVNLLLCCEGILGNEQTCDLKKRNTDVCDVIRNPKAAPTSLDTLVEVRLDGRVTPRGALDQGRAQNYLDDVLNLNHPVLIRNRLHLMNELRKRVGEKSPHPGGWSTAQKLKIALALRNAVGNKEFGSVYLALARRYEK